MTTAINDAIEAAYDALAGIEVEVSNAETAILKGNGRFKDSSVWVLLPSGKYKHVQSGKVTRASRLAGYTQAFSL